MYLGISSYALPWLVGVPGYAMPGPLTALALLQEAIGAGVRRLQYADNLPLHAVSAQELYNLRQRATENGLTLEVGTRGLTPDNMLRYLKVAQTIGSPFLRVVIDDGSYQPSVDIVVATIRMLLPHLEAAGVVLAIENHDRFPAQVLARIIVQTSPRWVAICLDTANSLGANQGIDTVLHHLAPYTINLHIKDISIQRVPHKMGFLVRGCPAGQGILRIPDIIDRVGSAGSCQSATLELWSDPDPDPKVTLSRERQWFDQSIAYLKTLLP